jgi:antitoxin component of MazEF toxin-antitoxin module
LNFAWFDRFKNYASVGRRPTRLKKGLRLPASVMEAAGLEPSDYVYVRLLDAGDIRVRPAKNVQLAGLPNAEPGGGAAAAVPRGETKW